MGKVVNFTEYRIEGLAWDAREARRYCVETGDMSLLDIVVTEIKRYELWLKTTHPEEYNLHFKDL